MSGSDGACRIGRRPPSSSSGRQAWFVQGSRDEDFGRRRGQPGRRRRWRARGGRCRQAPAASEDRSGARAGCGRLELPGRNGVVPRLAGMADGLLDYGGVGSARCSAVMFECHRIRWNRAADHNNECREEGDSRARDCQDGHVNSDFGLPGVCFDVSGRAALARECSG